ncbi:enoyl-CoA hydratase [Pseudomonas duriflava]|uniref:Enoyl-CoA hydratase n=1 Tax=Pseudomonas duriflava TaxID=459528 RepID=A0A562Q8X1_9PSED|nr:crotonase/enoyl-CoA hydratase family protein [Pseudomonas duriflava]TWI53169.1 enoyl-CoA hydratase [Pseudomonas duriflava]
MKEFHAFRLEQVDQVVNVIIDRPEKINAMNAAFWQEIREIFHWADQERSVRAIVLSGAGAHFSSGIDLSLLSETAGQLGRDVGHNTELLHAKILELQSSFNAVANCRKPVLAAIQGYCLGGAIDLIAACDMRYASADARFALKEIDLGMVADTGSLQRLPKLIGDGVLRELAFTGRHFTGEEALSIGLVNRLYMTADQMMDDVMQIAATIAVKSPRAIRGTKAMINYMQDHRIDDGLDYIATWNAAMLQSNDLRIALAAQMSRQAPDFPD